MRRAGRRARFVRFIREVYVYTPIVRMLLALLLLWMLFAAGVYLAEQGVAGSAIVTYGDALYWAVAAFSTAGIADTPISGVAKMIGGLWIVIGSALFFGTIVASITSYFMRPMQRPHKRIIDTIEYNLEQLNELSVDELDLLRKTVDTLIEHVEQLKERQSGPPGSGPSGAG